MSDQQIIEALIARDEQVTRQFFFGNCRPLFLSIIRYVFSYEVDYDEFVNEFSSRANKQGQFLNSICTLWRMRRIV